MSEIDRSGGNEEYWTKRRKNNEAARRSREKRRMNDLLLESRVLQLTEENKHLKAQLLSLKLKHGEADHDEPSPTGTENPLASFTENVGVKYTNDNHFEAMGNSAPVKELRSRDGKFTRRLITNATGDTSATVLVNSSPGFPSNSGCLPGFDVGTDPSLFANDNNPMLTARENERDGFSKEIFKQDIASFLSSAYSSNNPLDTTSIFDVAKMLDFKTHLSAAPNKLTDNNSLDRSDLPCPRPTPPDDNKSLFSTKISQFLQDYYGKVDPQFCLSFPQFFLPAGELLFQQLQLHFRKLQSMAGAEKNFNLSPSGCEKSPQSREEEARYLNQESIRHRSSDSGFGGSEDDVHSSTTPPASPDYSLSFASKFHATHPQGLLLRGGEDEEKNLEEKSSSSGCQQLEASSLENNSKNKSEFQLPHKLRLKRSSTKKDETFDPPCSSEDFEHHLDKPQAAPSTVHAKQNSISPYSNVPESSDISLSYKYRQSCLVASSESKPESKGAESIQLPPSKKRRLDGCAGKIV